MAPSQPATEHKGESWGHAACLHGARPSCDRHLEVRSLGKSAQGQAPGHHLEVGCIYRAVAATAREDVGRGTGSPWGAGRLQAQLVRGLLLWQPRSAGATAAKGPRPRATPNPPHQGPISKLHCAESGQQRPAPWPPGVGVSPMGVLGGREEGTAQAPGSGLISISFQAG